MTTHTSKSATGGTDPTLAQAKAALDALVHMTPRLRAEAAHHLFLHAGSDNGVLTAISGSNVLDGGTGSTFLVGTTGADGGADTFVVDGRTSHAIWDTVVNFHHGDSLTIWGFHGGVSTMAWADHQGAAGYQGATLHSALGGAGTGNVSITFAGMTAADAHSKLTMSTGSIGGNSYLYLKYV
jgi:hypothetical protein